MATATAQAPAVEEHPRPALLLRRLRRNPTMVGGACFLLLMLVAALGAPLLGTIDPEELNPIDRLRGPSPAHWFGTDMLGRDLYSRAVYGTRISLTVGLCVAVLSLSIGLAIGLLSGYLRQVDAVVMRIMDGLMAIPAILLAIALMALMSASVQNVIIALTIPEIPRVVRLVRALVLSLREQAFVEASRAVGAGIWRVLLRHITPNTVAPLIVQGTYICASAVNLRGLPQLPRRWHAAQHSKLGQHHGRGPHLRADRLLDHPLSRPVPGLHRSGHQPPRRRPTRYAGPQAGAAHVVTAIGPQSSLPVPLYDAAACCLMRFINPPARMMSMISLG